MKLWISKNILSRHLLWALVGAACIAATPTQAASPGAVGAVPYRQTGKVDNVILRHNQIVIGDMAYVLASNVSVLTGNNKPSSTTALRQGMRLGFNSSVEKHKAVITQIWILPTR